MGVLKLFLWDMAKHSSTSSAGFLFNSALEGIYHPGFEINGRFYEYGDYGLKSHEFIPEMTKNSEPLNLEFTYSDSGLRKFEAWICEEILGRGTFKKSDYNALTYNCIHFTWAAFKNLDILKSFPEILEKALRLIATVPLKVLLKSFSPFSVLNLFITTASTKSSFGNFKKS